MGKLNANMHGLENTGSAQLDVRLAVTFCFTSEA
jgi:hypothetical protein